MKKNENENEDQSIDDEVVAKLIEEFSSVLQSVSSAWLESKASTAPDEVLRLVSLQTYCYYHAFSKAACEDAEIDAATIETSESSFMSIGDEDYHMQFSTKKDISKLH